MSPQIDESPFVVGVLDEIACQLPKFEVICKEDVFVESLDQVVHDFLDLSLVVELDGAVANCFFQVKRVYAALVPQRTKVALSEILKEFVIAFDGIESFEILDFIEV